MKRFNKQQTLVDPAKKYFDKGSTDRERAVFEGGIALGAIYHQFTGIPISKDPEVIRAVEKAIKLSMETQPFKERVEVRVGANKIRGKSRDPYDYDVLKGSDLEIRVTTKYGEAKAVVAMKYVQELDYSLMFIERITEEKGT